MTTNDLILFAVYIAILVAMTPVLGGYMARVFARAPGPVESGLLRLGGPLAVGEQSWRGYAFAVLAFNLVGCLLLYALLRFQDLFPWNPLGLPGLPPALAFNTAISFITNTNWQAYSGEVALSYFSQMAGLTVQNFVSAGTGIAVALAVVRGFAGQAPGNFYRDLWRSVIYVLLPLSLLAAVILVIQGVPQNLNAYVDATTLEGGRQVIAQGPVAAQEAIKQLGTNGGGFFNANSAHPYENPTALSNLLELVFILLLPAAFCATFGRMVGDKRQGRALFIAMLVLFVVGLGAVYWAESAANPAFANLPLDQAAGNLEGKELRFGIGGSSLWATATTAASNGSVNAMHDSFSPLGGLVLLVNMQLGEIVFGGVGSGFYGMLLFVVIAVFIAGLMVGRTPEYLGRKIEAREVKLAVLAMLVMPIGVLGGTAATTLVPDALKAVQDAGPHGFSEILYAYSSATGNNGSAFAGFGGALPFHLVLQGFCMLLGRFGYIIPMLAIAASLAGKKRVPDSAGTFPTHGTLFIGLLIGVIVIVGGLTFFPALALGPIAEHLALAAGQLF